MQDNAIAETQAGFTPGPWTVAANDKRVIVPSPSPARMADFTQGEWIDCNTVENAQFFAAAPDMYEALKVVLGNLRSHEHQASGEDKRVYGGYLKIVEAALAKAEGRS